MSENNKKIERFIEKLKATSSQYQYEKIKLPDGSVIEADIREFYGIADSLASNYGIGACKNFVEFLDQIDETEDKIIIGLMNAIARRHEAMYGKPKLQAPTGPSRNVSGPQSKKGKGKRMPPPKQFNSPITDSKKVGYGEHNLNYNIQEMARFLKSFGANPERVNEAVKKAKAGQIDVMEYDFSWIDSRVLMDPDFPLIEVMKKMREAKEKSANFKVNLTTLNARK